MGDQGRWFKLWCSCDNDPDLDNLDVADFGRWCKLGILVKLHGTAGHITLRPPSRGLCAQFQVADFAALQAAFHRLPHVVLTDVSGETSVTVTFSNWAKYQGDFSTSRVRKYREMKRSKTRGDETRGEEKKIPLPPFPTNGHAADPSLRNQAQAVLAFLNEKTGRAYRETDVNLKLIEARLRSGATVQDCKSVIARKWREWGTDPKMTSYVRPATLFNALKFEQYRGEMG